jgi:tetratricopeptide (TPR) repeat protein
MSEPFAAAAARTMLQQATASKDSRATLEAGAAVLQAGLEDEAIDPVTAQIERDPNNAHLWLLLALLQRRAENMPASVDAIRRAVELNPGDPIIAGTRPFVMFEAGLPATELFDRAIALAPSHLLMLGKAASQVADGDRAGAIATLETYLKAHPLWLQGHGRLSGLRWSFGDDDFARSFEDALRQAPRDPNLWREYITAFVSAERHEEALRLIARARAAVGAHPSLDAAEAIVRSNLGEVDIADQLFLKLRPIQDVAVTEHLVRHYLRSGRAEEAAKVAEQWLPRDQEHRLWPYVSLAWRLTGDQRWQWLEGDPAFVGVYDIADALPPLGELAATLRRLHLTDRQPLALSLRGGTQTDGHLLQRIDPVIQQLRSAIANAVQRHIDQLPAVDPKHPLLRQQRAPIRFSGAWSVRLTGGGHHANHTHPQGWLSSALYVSLPDEVEAGDGQSGWLALGEAPELGVDLDPIRVVEPKPGRLVLFPSTMWHGTRPFGSGERLTVAFDVQRPGV